jgi:DNA adenine methylase
MSKLKSPISWFGGKYYMANKIIELFPEHKMYVEVFGGSGQILFSKSLSDIEVYNDIDRNLVNFFKILRDKVKFEQFKLYLDLTPYSREEFYECRDTWENETDEIEKIRKWYVTCMQSFSNNFSTWSHTKAKSRRGMSMAVSRYLGNAEENLLKAVERLKTVQIENMDSLKLITKYDNEDTLFYLDPPYIHETRKMTYQYAHEMVNSQHEQLVDVLLNIKGKAILSGYAHEIYNRLIDNGWRKVFLGEFVKRSVKTVGKEINEKGDEFVWVNF